MNLFETRVVEFLISQCKRCGGRGYSMDDVVFLSSGPNGEAGGTQQDPCGECAGLRDLLKVKT